MSLLLGSMFSSAFAYPLHLMSAVITVLVLSVVASPLLDANTVHSGQIRLQFGVLGAINIPNDAIKSAIAVDVDLAFQDRLGIGYRHSSLEIGLVRSLDRQLLRLELERPISGRVLWRRVSATSVLASVDDAAEVAARLTEDI